MDFLDSVPPPTEIPDYILYGKRHQRPQFSRPNTALAADCRIVAHPDGESANWMRNRNTIEFLGIWETLYNQDFNPLEFEGFRQQAGLNAFTLSPSRWIESTNQGKTRVKTRAKIKEIIGRNPEVTIP